MSYRFVVVDLGVMWNRRNYAGALRPTDRVVLPHEIVADVLKSPEWQKHVAHFEHFLKTYQRRVVVSRQLSEMAELEFRTNCPTANFEWIDCRSTEAIRRLSLDAPMAWGELKDLGINQVDERARDDFLEFCKRCPDLLKKYVPSLAKDLHASIEPAKEVIRDPMWGPLLAQAMQGMERFRTPAWIDRFQTFPDRYAFGRWSRLYVWYAFKWAAGHSRDFCKNFDDAGYAFAASYTGHLLTADEGLKECVRAVFAHVGIL